MTPFQIALLSAAKSVLPMIVGVFLTVATLGLQQAGTDNQTFIHWWSNNWLVVLLSAIVGVVGGSATKGSTKFIEAKANPEPVPAVAPDVPEPK